MHRLFGVIAFALLVTGCQALGPDEGKFEDSIQSLDSTGKPLPVARRAGTLQRIFGRDGEDSFEGAKAEGTGTFVSSRAPLVSAEPRTGGGEGFRLNLIDAPISAAAKNILGDTLGLTYTVDPRVGGTMTLQTSSPITRDALIDIFEAALVANGATIVQGGGSYQIVPINEALATTPAVSVPSVTSSGPGLKVQVIELRYVSAEEMRNILSPISREGSILRVDTARNLIVIAGNNSDLAAMRDAISVFDVDWMRGMSVALHPLKTSKPTEVARELETIFGVNDGPGAKIIRFVPNERLSSVLVITSRPQYLKRAASWIKQLDRLANKNEERLFVYNIQNRPADELAKVLQSVLSGGSSGAGESALPPDVLPTEVSGDPSQPSVQPAAFAPTTASGKNISVVADVENNALLISTTAKEFERIERILGQLDILPTQLLLEAVIAEVRLNDDLRFGVRWFFESGNFKLRLSDVASGFVGPSFPGLGWTYQTDNIQVTLNALNSVTDVKVISSPNLMAVNNQEAVLQIGDQVPIVTQQSTGTQNPDAPIINQVELKDTGIILTMTPRVNSSGRILLDIDQEVSNVTETTTSGIDSPTIQQRKISTRVAVNDGEALALGGLIQERKTQNNSQVPVLGDIPVLGNAFRDRTDRVERTELIIFIRPRIIRDVQEARSVTDEFRRKLDFRKPDFKEKTRGNLRRLQ